MARSKRSKGLKDKAYLAFIATLPCVCCWPDVMHGEAYWSELRPVGWVPYVMRPDFKPGTGGVQESRTEAAHVGPRGLSQKCSDRETIPLCAHHHRTGPESHHVLGRKFWEHHGLDRDALIEEFNDRYEQEKAA